VVVRQDTTTACPRWFVLELRRAKCKRTSFCTEGAAYYAGSNDNQYDFVEMADNLAFQPSLLIIIRAGVILSQEFRAIRQSCCRGAEIHTASIRQKARSQFGPAQPVRRNRRFTESSVASATQACGRRIRITFFSKFGQRFSCWTQYTQFLNDRVSYKTQHVMPILRLLEDQNQKPRLMRDIFVRFPQNT
jgi:hypothetical protein